MCCEDVNHIRMFIYNAIIISRKVGRLRIVKGNFFQEFGHLGHRFFDPSKLRGFFICKMGIKTGPWLYGCLKNSINKVLRTVLSTW